MGNSFWKGRKVLITGITGFIGCFLAEKLLEGGAEVFGYDIDEHHALDLHPGLHEKITVIRGDILDIETLAKAFSDNKINTCFHLAGQSMIEGGLTSPANTFVINVQGTWSVLEAVNKAKVERTVVSSSNTVYGPQTQYPFDEEAPLNGENPYAASKACTDIITRSYAKVLGLHAVACRQTNTFGPADPHETHIVISAILSLLKGEAPIIKSDGTPRKSYLYVEDTILGYIRLAEMAADPEVSGKAFNITTTNPPSVLELTEAIVKISGKDLAPNVVGTPETTRKENEDLSIKRSKEILGWEPKYTLEEGLKKTFDWYKENLDFYLETVEKHGHSADGK